MARIGIAVFAAMLCCFGTHATAAQQRPNIIIILADDFGVGNIQAHYPDNKIATPHLDRLVHEGMSFTDAHSSSAVCSPTRYGLLTGRYNWRTRLQEWVIAAYEPPLIAADRPTLPGMLRKHGYRTGCFGKWHLGWNWPGPQENQMMEKRNGQAFLTWNFSKPITGGPTDHGFDDYFGVDLPNLPPFTFIDGNRTVPIPTAKFEPDETAGIVLPTRFAGTPSAPEWDLQEILPTITRRAVQYIHDQAKEESPFFLYFSLTTPHEPIVPSREFQGKSGIAPIADFVMQTDAAVGQVLHALDEAGIAEDTLVIFTADNGHSHYTGWNDLVAAGQHPSGPYRGHKGDIWEGGHRIPLVIRWPGRVAANSQSEQLICLTDLFATCADVVEASLPENGAEDSISFLPALLEKSSEAKRQSVVSHSNFGEFAYREGDWKLVYRLGGRNLEKSRGRPTVAELYNLDDDIDESKDLAEYRPDVVERLTEQLEELIERGSSRSDQPHAQNDCDVRYDVTQTERWAAARAPESVAEDTPTEEEERLSRLEEIADAALVPPTLNTSPLPEYDYDQLDYGMTIGIAQTPRGRLWACWVAGGDSPKAFFVLASSDDDGETWSKPRLVLDSHSDVLPFGRSILVGNLWTDPQGRLWLFFDQSMQMFDGRGGVWTTVCENPDSDDPVWSAPRRIWHGVTLNKPTVLSNGDWMLPVSLDQRGGLHEFRGCFRKLDPYRGANVFVSSDQGASWLRRGKAVFPNPDWHEHMIVERKDGSLWMLARTAKGIMESTSTDAGRTWTGPVASSIKHPNARFHVRRLASGRLLLIKHGDRVDSHQGRVQLSAWLSDDDGQNWFGGLVLDERPGVSYPDGFQAPDGTVFISYDRNRSSDGEILLARFSEEDVAAGKLISPNSRLKLLISRPLAEKAGASRGE